MSDRRWWSPNLQAQLRQHLLTVVPTQIHLLWKQLILKAFTAQDSCKVFALRCSVFSFSFRNAPGAAQVFCLRTTAPPGFAPLFVPPTPCQTGMTLCLSGLSWTPLGLTGTQGQLQSRKCHLFLLQEMPSVKLWIRAPTQQLSLLAVDRRNLTSHLIWPSHRG